MICNKIQALEYPSGVPAELLTGGVLFLDTDDDFGIRQTRRAEELNAINKITVSAALGVSLPETPKNFLVLGKFINPNIHDFDFRPLRVIAYSASNVITHSLLYVLRHDEIQGRFECELRDDESHWIVSSKKRKLRDTPYDPFTLTRANVEANFAQNEYAPGDPGIYCGLVYYGAWKEGAYVTVADTRPLYHIKHILEKCFALDGWIFKSPIFDLPIGKKLVSYLIEPYDVNQAQVERPNTFWAVLSTDTPYTVPVNREIILFDTEQYDNNNVYDPATGYFSARGNYDVHFFLYLKNIGNPEAFGERYKVRIVRLTGSVRTVLFETSGEPRFLGTELTYTDSDEWIVEGLKRRVQLNAQDKIWIEVDLPGIGERITGGGFYNLNNVWVLVEDEPFEPASIIGDYRLYDLFRGVVHLFSAKIHTDHNRREIWLYPNYKTKWWDDEIDGYYLDQTVSLLDLLIKDSSVVSSVNQDAKRYMRLQFKVSTDLRIQGLNYPKDKPIFSKTVDLGEHFENELEVNENPFFEPTVNDKVFSIRPTVIDPAQEYFIDMPFMVDNDEGFPSFLIEPRILIAHGEATYKGPTGQEIYWRWYETTRTTVPYLSQLPNHFDATGAVIKEALIYGDQLNDLYSTFWKRWIYDNFVNTKVNVLAYLNPNKFHSMDFRKVYEVLSNGKSVFGRIVAINDFDGCGNTATPIELLPSAGSLTAPVYDDGTDEEFCAGQNPVLLVTETVPGTWNASYQDTYVTDTGVSYLIEWRYFDTATWTTGTDVVNPTKPFYFRLKVVLETCGTIYRIAYIDPCGGNKPVIVWSNMHTDPGDPTKYCITATIGGILNQDITVYDLTSTKDGGTPAAYTQGTELCGIVGEVIVEGTLQFDNDCDPVPIYGIYTFPPVQVNCADNVPEVVCVHQGIGMFTFDKAGTWASPLSVYFIQYREPGGGANDWKIWNTTEPAPIPGEVEIRGVFFWCDTCPPVCTDVVTCLEPGPMFAGDPQELQMKSANKYQWDWSKLPKGKEGKAIKKQFRDLYMVANGAKVAALHNKYNLSEHWYCCGDDPVNALKHVKKAIDDGQI